MAGVLETPEQERLLALGRRRALLPPGRRELAAEALVAFTFLAVALAMALLLSSPRGLERITLALLIGAYVVTSRAKFDIADGYTVPTELVLVPMLFLLPTPAVPLVVSFGYLLGRMFDYASGRTNVRRALHAFGDCWHSVGPAAVLVVAHAQVFSWDHWPVYLLALLAQFAFDFTATAVRERLVDGTPAVSLLGLVAPVYALDGALAPVGLLAAFAAVQAGSALCILIVPLAAILSVLSRERQARVDHALELSNAYKGTVMLLGEVVEADDAYTGSHSRDVVDLSNSVADRLGLDSQRRRNVEFAALLHDVGKITVPKEIVNKPGPLDDHEWAIMRRHTVEGEAMLNRVGGLLSEVGRIVRSCHEHYDGSGYPDSFSGETIPIEARIVSCCDAFSAMTTTRSYRGALPLHIAIEELKACAGSQFDPDVVDALVEIVGSTEDVLQSVVEPSIDTQTQ